MVTLPINHNHIKEPSINDVTHIIIIITQIINSNLISYVLKSTVTVQWFYFTTFMNSKVVTSFKDYRPPKNETYSP